jgi:hypothetical protein
MEADKDTHKQLSKGEHLVAGKLLFESLVVCFFFFVGITGGDILLAS